MGGIDRHCRGERDPWAVADLPLGSHRHLSGWLLLAFRHLRQAENFIFVDSRKSTGKSQYRFNPSYSRDFCSLLLFSYSCSPAPFSFNAEKMCTAEPEDAKATTSPRSVPNLAPSSRRCYKEGLFSFGAQTEKLISSYVVIVVWQRSNLFLIPPTTRLLPLLFSIPIQGRKAENLIFVKCRKPIKQKSSYIDPSY